MSFSQANNVSSNLQATYKGSVTTRADVSTWIKKQWATMVRRELEQNQLMRRYVWSVTFPDGKKGDRVTIPTMGRLAVNDKVATVPVTLQKPTVGTWAIDITRHKETSFMVEDIAEMMLDPNGLFATNSAKEAAYAISRDIDAQLLALRALTQTKTAQVLYSNNEAAASTNVASQPFNLTSFLRAKLKFDQAGVPAQKRVLIVSPTQYLQILALDKMQSVDFTSSKSLETGVVGQLMGVPVYMTNMIGANSATGFMNGSTAIPTPGVTGAGSIYYPDQGGTATSLPVTWNTTANTTPETQEVHTAMLLSPDAYALAMLQEPKTETSRETLYLADSVVTSTVYGCRDYRDESAVLIHTNGVIPQT
jgi:hypothetical protein